MTLFYRILLACLLPLVIIFSSVIYITGDIVYESTVSSAEDISRIFADELSKYINDGFVNAEALVKIVAEHVAAIDGKDPDAEEKISEWIKSILKATPYVYNIWISFEPGGFLENERFSRDYINIGDTILVKHGLDDDILDNPEEAPWYYYPLVQGTIWFETVDWYDYGVDAGGNQYVGTVSMPIKHDGKVVGVAGVDMLYQNIFSFIEDRQIGGEQKISVISQFGEIIFAPDTVFLRESFFDFPLDNLKQIQEMFEGNEPFNVRQSKSPFLGVSSMMFFHPVAQSRFDNRSAQLFICVDRSTHSLFDHANHVLKIVIIAGALGMIVFSILFFVMVNSILKPIKKLTAGAKKIAANDHIGFDDVLQSSLLSNDAGGKINEFNMLSDALKKMHETLVQRDNYKKISDAKSEFLAKMSHEIRTPMNAITGMAELALREEMSPAAKEHIITIRQAGANLLSIINDILDLSKIESGKLEIVPIEYQFASIVNDVVSIIRMRLVNSSVRFTVNIDRKIPAVLQGDEVRVRQIFLNILSNAVKYTSTGSITLTIRGEVIDHKNVILTVDVTDTGIGIKPEDIEKLFVSFVQADVKTNVNIEGTGLGLAITKNLVTQMGGEIGVSSVYGKGSTFTVTLPQKIKSHQPLAEVFDPQDKSVLIYERRTEYVESMLSSLENLGVVCANAKNVFELCEKLKTQNFAFLFIEQSLYNEEIRSVVDEYGANIQVALLTRFGSAIADGGLSVVAMPPHVISIANILNGVTDSFVYNTDEMTLAKFSAPKARVLIVDDIKTNLEVAKGLLKPYGMTIDTCENGAEAIEAVKATHYDLVLMDHMMPEMDGIEATRQIRALPADVSGIPIVALTANAVYGVREMFLQNGFNDFISKPIDTIKLGLMLERWIPKNKQEPPIKQEVSSYTGDDLVIDGIDVKAGIARTGGNAESYVRTLGIFCEDGLKKSSEIESALAANDLPLYTTLVHALKGASANVGAVKLSESAFALEEAARRGDQSYISANTKSVLAALKTLLSEAGAVLARKKAEQGSAVEVDLGELKPLLSRLKTALDEVDINVLNDTVKALEPYKDVDPNVKEIINCALGGDYDVAGELIEKII